MTQDNHPAFTTVPELVDACYAHLESNHISGERWGMTYSCYKPSNTKYGSYQWLWDSGWHMITWSHRDVARSIADMRSMLQFQQPDGFIPEMIFWGEKGRAEWFFDKFVGYSNDQYTDITQMPMLPFSVRAMYEATNDVVLLEEFVPKLARYFEWWERTRDPDGDGLVSIIHGWESGIDASPIYDLAYGVKDNDRGKFWKTYPKFLTLKFKYKHVAKWNVQKILQKGWFNVEDVGVNCVYAAGWGVLAKLAEKFDGNLAKKCSEKQDRFERAIVSKCWNEGLGRFTSYYHKGHKEHETTANVIQSLFPVMLDALPGDLMARVLKELKDPEKYWLTYPVPSVAKSDPQFNPNQNRLLWRGPMWPATTWFVMEGLTKHGHDDIARYILHKWVDLCLQKGIWEYYDPLTGEGEGERGLGMSTIVVDMIHRLEPGMLK